MNRDHSITIKPDWRSFTWSTLTGFVLIPFFGLGIVILWIIHKQRRSIRYEVHNRLIRQYIGNEVTDMELIYIEKVSVRQTWIEKRFDTGTIDLAANVSRMKLLGIRRPEVLADMIRQAIQSEKMRELHKEPARRPEPEHDPGTLDRLDYLAGLWQQGLISEKEYRNEKKHFD